MTDYLWDKSGDPDPDIQRLERALGVFAQPSPPPPFDSGLGAGPSRLATLSAPARWVGLALLAASVVPTVGALTLAVR